MDLIDVVGLDEEIRCEMCRNPMHTDRGCDGNCKYDEKLYERIMQILDERIKPLPSAQPQRAKGKWITEEENYIKQIRCSECGKNALCVFVADDHYGNCVHGEVKITNFCPNCGANMRGEQDE